MSYRIATYNIENMRLLFKQGAILPGMRSRADAIANVIASAEPDILGIVEAGDKIGQHRVFLEETVLKNAAYNIAKSNYKRKSQDLVFYYRPPFELVSLDAHIDFYASWIEDIDDDGIDEVCKFERKPLEARFRHQDTGNELLVILISIKSKGVFTVSDLIGHQHLALANRKRQYAQAKKLRQRLDRLITAEPELPVIVMGDFNDEPGLDNLERLLGVSALETIMGSIFEPTRIFHNTLRHMCRTNETRKELWTTEYPDLIVQNFKKHKGWLDHILVSPSFFNAEAAISLIPDSGRIAEKTETAKSASDHFLIYCDLEISDESKR